MSSPKSIALLYQFKVSLNTNGELIVDWEGPPSSQEVVNAFDEWNEDSRAFKEVIFQLRKYFDGRLKEFSIPIFPSGTKFQLDVYRQLLKIPYGETRTYSEIAKAIGNTKAVRAVGSANSKNPLAIIIPCHRVIGRDGTLTGFAGGLEAKKALLQLEQG